jgi:hypothetical protein
MRILVVLALMALLMLALAAPAFAKNTGGQRELGGPPSASGAGSLERGAVVAHCNAPEFGGGTGGGSGNIVTHFPSGEQLHNNCSV